MSHGERSHLNQPYLVRPVEKHGIDEDGARIQRTCEKEKHRRMRENKAGAICMQMKHENQIYRPSIWNKREEQRQLQP